MKSAFFLMAFAISSLISTGISRAETAIFAGGCFWCIQSDFDKVKGVTSTEVGYAGGTTQKPTYKNYGNGGHREVIKVDFNPAQVSYEKLTSIFLRSVDPTDAGGQFCDRGFPYSTAVYALNDQQAKSAKKAIAQAQKKLGGKIVTPVEGAAKFWPAEDYHQKYYLSQTKQLSRFGWVTRAKAYKGYRKGCGRDHRVKQVWGDQAYQGIH